MNEVEMSGPIDRAEEQQSASKNNNHLKSIVSQSGVELHIVSPIKNAEPSLGKDEL